MTREPVHSYKAEVAGTYRRQAVPVGESSRRVAVEALTDFLAGLAVIAAVVVLVVMVGAIARFAVATLPWSAIYLAVVGAGILGLCRIAAKGSR